MKAIIIDDEKKAGLLLQSILDEIQPELEIEAIFQDPSEAIEHLKIKQPALLFLDIEMPEISGFELLTELGEIESEIIFVTSYNVHAIEAFSFAACGFVLKPIDSDSLTNAIQIAKHRISLKSSVEQNRILLNNMSANIKEKRIGIPTMFGLEFLKINDIVRCEGIEKCTKVIDLHGNSIVSSYSIGEFNKLLQSYGFFQVHKSHIINLDLIQQYRKEGTITMDDGSSIPLARRKKQIFLEQLTRI